ncbi:MAG: stage II sporulation protein R [Clostridia bacterium]|nr:stage II sporulation protein R [Clostridia bacterium]
MKKTKQIMKKIQPIRKFFNENKKVITAVLLVFLIGTLLGMVSEAKEISEKFVRFHIVANSDSREDQTVKMKVREAIFTELDFSHITSKEEALSYFTEHKEEIKCIADRVLWENGFDYKAAVSVGKKDFPVREYSDFVLPAGTYDAISITLGEGNGQNFFCVMYPSLCKIEGVTESTDNTYQILNHVLTEKETAVITGNKTQIVYKFKIVELLDKLF